MSFVDCNRLFNDCTKWCIAGNNHHWDHYAGVSTGNAQYFIINFDLEDTENLKLIGFTVNQEGKLTAAHAINDDSLMVEPKFTVYTLKNGFRGHLSWSCADAVNLFEQYTKTFGLRRFINGKLMGEDEKSLKYLFKKLFS